ncbi:MAG: ribosome maturation factor RimP [Oscillospiraceae bacterium]
MAEKKKNTVAIVWDIAEPIAKELGLILWDVRFQKEGVNWYLRIFIDREDRPVDIDDCVNMSHAMDTPLDEQDPIDQSYSMQVSSPGIERELTRDFHFLKYLGEKVMIKLIHAANEKREYNGILELYDDGLITIKLLNGEKLQFNKKEASWVKLDDFEGF